MLKTLHKDQYTEITFDEEKGILYSNYSPITKDMEEDDFRAMLVTWKDTVNLSKTHKVIIDSKSLLFPIDPDMQIWIVENINQQIIIQNTKSAFLMPEEFIANLAMEQYIDEANNTGRETRYFATIEEAEKWLLA